MKKRQKRLITGTVLMCIGALLLFFGSYRSVFIISDGEVHRITSASRNVENILQQAGIRYDPKDQIIPGLNQKLSFKEGIRINHSAEVRLNRQPQNDSYAYSSRQAIAGNMLLDAGIRLYPGDRLFWKDTPIQPEFSLGGVPERDLTLTRASSFLLWTEDADTPVLTYGSGATVGEAVISAGIQLTQDLLIIPAPDTPFVEGMPIEVTQKRELTVASNGRITTITSGGTTVGEALAYAGFPLMGSDVSIPAAGEPLPEDGRILIVPVRDEFSMTAKAERGGIDWQADDSLELDQTRMIREGQDGLTGQFRRVRYEGNEEVLDHLSEEMTLSEPQKALYAYGTKVNIRTLDTPEGPVEYWRSVPVYATSYSPCRSGTGSCISGTASGAKVEKGIIGVSSAWYGKTAGLPVYVPDYGRAVIGDTGGGIAGKKWIDLAYSDEDYVAWSSDTTLYFLTPVPAEIPWVLQ